MPTDKQKSLAERLKKQVTTGTQEKAGIYQNPNPITKGLGLPAGGQDRSQALQNNAIAENRVAPGAGSTLAQQKEFSDSISNRYGVASGVPGSDVASSTNRLTQIYDLNKGQGVPTTNTSNLNKNIAAADTVEQKQQIQATANRTRLQEDFIKNFDAGDDNVTSQLSLNLAEKQARLAEMTAMGGAGYFGRGYSDTAKVVRDLENKIEARRVDLGAQRFKTDVSSQEKLQSFAEKQEAERSTLQRQAGAGGVSQTMAEKRLGLGAREYLYFNPETANYEVRTGDIEDSDPIVRAENRLQEDKDNAIADVDKAYADAIARAEANVAQYGSGQAKRNLAKLLKDKADRISKIELQADRGFEDLILQEEKRQATIEEALLSGGGQRELTTAERKELEFEVWANEQRALDPTVSTEYLENKYAAINKYEAKDPNAKANIKTWETKLANGEIDTSNQVETFQSAVDLTGDPEKAFELLKTTGNTEVANEFRSAWTEKKYGTGAVTRQAAVDTVSRLFTGEEPSPDAVIKFVEESKGEFPESFISRQLQNIANSDSANVQVKAMAQDYLNSEYKQSTTTTSADVSTMIDTLTERPDLYDGLPASTKKELLNAGFIPEAQGGSSLSFDQKINIPAIGRMLYGARISDKETERVQDIVTSPEAQGLDRFGLIQRIIGFNVNKNEELAEGLMNQIISVAPEGGLADFDMLGLARLLNEDKAQAAIRKVETFSNALAKKNEGERFISESFVGANVQKYNNVMSEMNRLSQELGFGPIEGSIAKSIGKFKSTERKQIAGKMAASIAKMRNELLGSAVTEAEKEFLADVLPDETDRIEDTAVKLDTLKENAIIELNAMRSVYGMPPLSEQELLNKELKERLYSESSGVFTAKDLERAGVPANEVESISTDLQRELGKRLNKNPEQFKSDYEEIKSYGGTVQDLMDYYSQDVSDEVQQEIKSSEGFREQAYLDTSGVPTVGYGFTKINGRPVQVGDTITQEEADQELKRQIAAHSNYKDLITVNLSPSQEAALASFEYNLGANIWEATGGKIIEAINSGDIEEAARIMKLHNKGRDSETKQLAEVKGLTNRRNREAELLMNL